jgi:hypothetical protein
MTTHCQLVRPICMLSIILGTIVLVSCSQNPSAQPARQQSTSSASSTTSASTVGPQKLALLIGINNYKYVYPTLHGAENDVDAMKVLLMSKAYGFKDADIHVLKNEQASRQKILEEIDEYLIKKAKANDVVVIHFSGHGSTLDDPSDPFGYDNTIVPYDSRDPERKVWDIRDKELNARARRLSDLVGPNGNVTFILDSCHSGTGLKAVGIPRAVAKDTRFGKTPPPLDLYNQPKPTNRDATGSGYSDKDINYVLLAGSRSDLVSYETPDSKNGELTYYLVQELSRPSAVPRTYRDVMNKVIQSVHGDYREQTPQLEGKNQDQVVFGNATLATGNYIVTNPLSGSNVELQGGRILGFTKDSVFDVYDPSAHTFSPPEKPLASVRLTDVQEFKSIGTIVGPAKQVPSSSKAIEREHNFAGQKTRVLIENLPNSPKLQAIKTRLEQHPRHPFELVDEGKPFQIRIVESGNQIRTFGPDGMELSTGISANSSDLSDRVERRLLDWARWFSLMSLTNPGTTAIVEFTMTPAPVRPGLFVGFTPGDKRFDLKVKNLTPNKLFIYILDITSAGKVQQVYPDLGSTSPLDPNQEMPINDWGVALPQGYSYIRDVFKLIVTTNQIDIGYLQMDTPKGAENQRTVEPPNDPLNRLLFEAASGARDATRKVADNWYVSDVTFEVCSNVNAGQCPHTK